MRLHFNKKGLSSASFSRGNMTYNTNGRFSYLIRGKNKRSHTKKHNSSLLVDFTDSSLRRMAKSRDFVNNCSKTYIIGRTILGVLGLPIGIILALMANAETPFWGLVIGSAISFWGFAIWARINDAKILDKMEGKKIKKLLKMVCTS